MARDKRAVERAKLTGVSYAAALKAIRDEANDERTARLAVVMHAARGWSDAELAALEKAKGTLGFCPVGSKTKILGEIDSADIIDSEHGESLNLVLRVRPECLESFSGDEPIVVELDDSSYVHLARLMSSE